MSKANAVIKFDGPLLDGRSMDVADLAPALMSLSELVKEVNVFANGDRAGVKVLVNADLEQNCFELNLELAQTIYEQAKLLISDDYVKTAKEIAEWIGLISGAAAPPALGLFWLIKKLSKKQVKSVSMLEQKDGQNMLSISVKGHSETITVNQSVFQLYQNESIRKKALKVTEPLKKDGYETLSFHNGDVEFFSINEDEIPVDDSELPAVTPQNVHNSKIRTSVRIRKAVYEGGSKWTVTYKNAIEAAIKDEAWLENFQSGDIKAPPGSSLEVTLDETYITNERGEMLGNPTYEILEVHGVELHHKTIEMKF